MLWLRIQNRCYTSLNVLKGGQFERSFKQAPRFCAQGREYHCTIISFLQNPAANHEDHNDKCVVIERLGSELLGVYARFVSVRLTDAEMVHSIWK